MISLAWEGDWPISQHFGANPPLYLPHYPGHEGIDIAIPEGIPVRALFTGWVIEVGLNGAPLPAYGYYVKLRSNETAEEVIYAHLQPYRLAAPGELVGAGERIGITGASGRIFGVHLHIGYRRDWRRRSGPYRGFSDPLPAL